MRPGWASRKRRIRSIHSETQSASMSGLFLSSGKSTERLLSLSDERLHEMLGCTESHHRDPSSKRIELEALLPGYVSRLTRKGASVRKLFKEYHAEYPDGYRLSSFKRIVR